MKILIVAPFVPHPRAGHAGGVVLWRMMQDLAVRHDLTLVSFAGSAQEESEARRLSDCCTAVKTVLHPGTSVASDFGQRAAHRARCLLLSRLPYSVWRMRSKAMFSLLHQVVRDNSFDIVQVELISMGQYVRAFGGHPATVCRAYDLAAVDAQRRAQAAHSPWQRAYHHVQWGRMARYELDTFQKFHRIIMPSEKTKNDLLRRRAGLNVSAIPFGVTLPDDVAPEPVDNKRILFIGAMGRPLNVESVIAFAERTWPLIQAQERDAEFWIVGSDPPAQIRRLADQPGITVTGFVEDLLSVYAQASVVVVPLLVGGGVVTKILDAMALRKAVVATSVANEGIGAISARDLILADTPQDFARSVVELLRDPARRETLSRQGRNLVESKFAWPAIVAQFENLYEEMVRSG